MSDNWGCLAASQYRTYLSSKSPFSLGCHMTAVGLADSSMRWEHTVLAFAFTFLTHKMPVARVELAKSYSTQYLKSNILEGIKLNVLQIGEKAHATQTYWSSETEIRVSCPSFAPKQMPVISAV